MIEPSVLSKRRGSVGVVTLNRPRQLNALSAELMSALVDAVGALAADREVGALVVTGGTEVFAAGADLKQMAEKTAVDMLVDDRIRYWDSLRQTTRPLIAAVSGYA